MTPSTSFSDVVVVGGNGAVGSLLLETLHRTGSERLTVIDRRVSQTLPRFIAMESDIRAPSAEVRHAIAAAGLTVLAVPEDVAIAAIDAVLRAMKPHSLLVDTLSVKTPFAEALQKIQRPGVEVLGINPMFAPSLGFAGRSVAAVPYAAGALAASFLSLLRGQQCEVVELGVEQHDRACAALQVATHAAILSFGMTLRALDYEITAIEPIMPPPHRTMLALLARILNADPEVYRDVQTANPFAAQVRGHLRAAQDRLERLGESRDSVAFAQAIADLQQVFAGSSVDYAELCARLFQVRER